MSSPPPVTWEMGVADVSLRIASKVLDTDLRNFSLIFSNSLLGDMFNAPVVTVRLVLVVLVVVIDLEVSVFGFFDGDDDGFLIGDEDDFLDFTSTTCNGKIGLISYGQFRVMEI